MGKQRHAASTRLAYQADWDRFVRWCDGKGLTALPARPEVIAAYIAELRGRGLSRSTLRRYLASISAVHRGRRLEAPETQAIRAIIRGGL